MFRTVIAETPLTTDAANALFTNITGDSFRGDYSFLATLRALIAPRLKEDEKICLRFTSSSYNADDIYGVLSERAVEAICDHFPATSTDPGSIVIHSFSNSTEENRASFEVIEENFTQLHPEFHRLEKVTGFYRKSFNVDCYIDPDKKSAILFVDRLDVKRMHYLQIAVFALPFYFDPEQGATDLEMELIYSLRETAADKYMDCLRRIASQYDFRTPRIRQLLSGFEKRYEQMELDRVRQNILNWDQRINSLNSEIGSCLSSRNEDCIRLLGLEQKIAQGGEDSEIMEYFLCNQHLVLEQVSGTSLFFSVKDYLTYFDSDMAERAINNRSSYLYPDNRSESAKDDMQKLYKEIFLSEAPRLRVRFCAAYKMEINSGVYTNGHHDFGYDFSDYMPNPHIDEYNCIGNYSRTLNQLMRDHNYISALEQCVASCKSLNFGDSVVMGTFAGKFWSGRGTDTRCIELPDGRVVTPKDAIAWLKEQDQNETEKKEEVAHE